MGGQVTTSGTTVFNLDFINAIEDAFERAGLSDGPRSGYEMKTARRSIDIMFADWANRGINLWTVEERSMLLTTGVADYVLETDIVDVIEHMVQIPPTTNQVTRYNLSRVSVSTFASRTNPENRGRPTELYLDRQRDAPIAKLWPVPGDAGPYTLVYWVLRRIEDAGAYTNTADFPFRFLPAFIAGLAFMIAEKKRTDDPALIARLEDAYDKSWQRAADTDRDRATLSIVPLGSAYRVGRI